MYDNIKCVAGITKESLNVVNSLADSDGASEESAEPAETENECSHIPPLNRVHRGSLTKKTSKHQASHPLYQRDTSNLDTPKVAALEVQNVKRAINRYGTLPKGARIGAYLESLRHGNGESSETNTTKPPANNRTNVPLRRPFQQPGNMTRSNSSTNFQPSSPRTLRAQPPPPNLADLEFPPPPPPEDLDHEEMSTFRFGVSLRHREPSTDSCNSAKSEPTRLKCVRKDKVPADNNKLVIDPSPVLPKKNIAEVSPSSDEDAASKDVKNLVPDIMKEMMELKHHSASCAEKKITTSGGVNKDEQQQQRSSSPVDFKTNLRKISKDDRDRDQQYHLHYQQQQQQQQLNQLQRIDNNIAEIKSQLKKVKIDEKKECGENNILPESASGDGDGAADDKRRSTGSISSLKKLWEGESPPSEVVAATTTVKERRVWPPPHDDNRPAVPVKPSAAATAKCSTTAGTVAIKSNAIYATPGAVAPSTIVEQWQTVDASLRALRAAPAVTSAGWLSLSDKVGVFHSSCLNYADTAAPPNLRFHLRELLNKLESQSRQMRSAGGGRQQTDHTTIFQTLDTTLKDILTIIQR